MSPVALRLGKTMCLSSFLLEISFDAPKSGVPRLKCSGDCRMSLAIWGVVLSKDESCEGRVAMAIKAKGVCNTINKFTSFNSLSQDVALAAPRLSLQPRAKYNHKAELIEKLSKDDNCGRGTTVAIKAKGVRNTVNKFTPFNTLSHDIASAALRLSRQSRAKYHHQAELIKEIKHVESTLVQTPPSWAFLF